MNSSSKRSFKLFGVLSLTVAIISTVVLYILSSNGTLPQKAIYSYPLFFLIINVIVHLLLLHGSEKTEADFINYFLIGTSIKLLVYFMFLVVYITLISKTNNKSFAAVFFSLYILFTSVEVFSIVKHIKNADKQKKNGQK